MWTYKHSFKALLSDGLSQDRQRTDFVKSPTRMALKKKSQCERLEFSTRKNVLSLGHGPNTD